MCKHAYSNNALQQVWVFLKGLDICGGNIAFVVLNSVESVTMCFGIMLHSMVWHLFEG